VGTFNYAKYKRKKANKAYYVVIATIMVVSLSVGYSIFSETISINGTAHSNEYVTDKLEVGLILQGSVYVSATFSNANLTLNGESYDGVNNISKNFTRKNTKTTLITTSYSINFRNTYGNNLTSGSVSYQIVSGDVTAVSPSITSASLIPNATATLNVSMTHRNSGGTVQVVNTMQYTYLGIVKYFYFTINMA
jgi:hypothetical protein